MAAIDKESAKIVFFAVIGFIFQYSCNIYMARFLSPADYGDFAVAISLLLILSTALEIGASKSIPKYLHSYQHNQDTPRITGLLRGYLTATFLVSFLVALLGTGLGYLDLEITHKGDSIQHHPFILALCFLPFIAPSGIFAASLKCINPRVNAELPRLSLYGLTLLFLWLLTVVGFKENDWLGIAVFGSANMLVLAIYIVLAVRYLPRNYIQVTPTYEWQKWLHTSIPIMSSSSLVIAIRQVDLFMVEAFAPGEANVAYFAAASQIAQALIVINTTLNLLYGSRIGKSLTEGRKSITRTLRSIATFMGCFCLIFLSCVLFFGKFLLGLFGENYIQAYPTMILLTIAASMYVISGGCTTFLQFYGKQLHVLAVQIGILLFSIALNSILIPRYGILGAATAGTICFTCMALYFIFRAIRLLRKVK